MSKGSLQIRTKPTPNYPHKSLCNVCNKWFYARYNYKDRAKVCTPPEHKCRPGKKSLLGGGVRKIRCLDGCCRSKYQRGATDRVSDISIDHRKFLNDAQFWRVIKESKNLKNPYGLAIRFIAATGVRVGEVPLLRPEHFRLDQEFPDVVIPTLKRTGRPLLPVELNEDWILDELREWVKQVKSGHPVFNCSRRHIQRQFSRLIDSLFLDKDGGIHMLRHTRASRLVVASGGDMNYVRKQLRWSSLETGKSYMHTSDEQRRDIRKKLKGMK